MPYGQTAPTINPNTFPYAAKFSQPELDDLLERIEDLRHAMTDAVGPSGVMIWLDAGSIANLSFHLAMAGARIVDDEKAYIWAEKVEDEERIFDDQLLWHLKKDRKQPPPAPVDDDEISKQADMARKQINAQLPPEVRKALLKQLAKEFTKDTTDKDDD